MFQPRRLATALIRLSPLGLGCGDEGTDNGMEPETRTPGNGTLTLREVDLGTTTVFTLTM